MGNGESSRKDPYKWYKKCPTPGEGSVSGSFHAYFSRALLYTMQQKQIPFVSPRLSIPMLLSGTYCVPSISVYGSHEDDDCGGLGMLPSPPLVFLQLDLRPQRLAACLGVPQLTANIPEGVWGYETICIVEVLPKPRLGPCQHVLCASKHEVSLVHHVWAFAPGNDSFPVNDSSAIVHCIAALPHNVSPAHQQMPTENLERGLLFLDKNLAKEEQLFINHERDAARRAMEQDGGIPSGKFYGPTARAVTLHGCAFSPCNCQVTFNPDAEQPGCPQPYYSFVSLSICHERRKFALVLHIMPATTELSNKLRDVDLPAVETVGSLLDVLARDLHHSAADLVERAILASVQKDPYLHDGVPKEELPVSP